MSGKRQFTQIEKARRGWWASVVFMLMIVLLIIFLSYVKIVDENRDILVGIIGVITGSISGMLAIASGRDPSELDELKEELAAKNADREALIARLRDAQIQMQLLRDQVFELQMAIINKLSMFHGDSQIERITEDQIQLKDVVDQWTPKSEDEVDEES
jgi:hypothetical protein